MLASVSWAPCHGPAPDPNQICHALPGFAKDEMPTLFGRSAAGTEVSDNYHRIDRPGEGSSQGKCTIQAVPPANETGKSLRKCSPFVGPIIAWRGNGILDIGRGGGLKKVGEIPALRM